MNVSTRQTVIQGLSAMGLDRPARRLRASVQPWWVKRNAADEEQLRRLMMLALPADANCVDVGANIGAILDVMVDAAPRGQHVAFEPVPWLADALLARHPEVEVRREAVAATAGEATFSLVANRPSISGLTETAHLNVESDKIQVPTVRLDEVLTAPASLIKIDVEGGELGVLQGARETLASHRPMVAFEHGHGGHAPDVEHCLAVFDELANADLRVFDMDGTYLSRRGFEQVYVSGKRWNFLAHR